MAAATATVARVTADTVRLERDFHRLEELHRKGLISTQEFDAMRATYEAAAARLREAEEQLKLVQEGPRQEQIAQARAALAQARARYKRLLEGPRKEEIERARARLEKARETRAQAEFTPKNVQTAKERVKLVYRIKVDILNPSMELKPGMPADAAIVVAQPQ
jgi:HlyD family secretion protein